MSYRLGFTAWLLAAMALCMGSAGTAHAAAPPAASTAATPAAVDATPQAAANAVPQLDAKDLGTFFDGLVPYVLQRNDIAGGVVAVVKDGRLIFARGYGYADIATRTPVVADKTLFRIGSVSKLFTWTAVMQLVAAGKINLDANVNQYLDFKVPEAFGKPVTMRELMTHTAGFEETIRDLMVPTPQQLPSLRHYLIANMPARIYPPGKIVAYSNYGAALAGYIVQRVAKQPLHEYIAEHILQPLGMSHTTTLQPVPAALRAGLATGYLGAAAGKRVPFEPVVPWPAGSVSATATDMAKFMIAQLQGGQFEGASILSPAATALMHTQQYAAAPGMNGFDLGFYQGNRNGLQIIGHGGDTIAFHSDLQLLPGKDVGIFMSFNSAGKGGLATVRMRAAVFDAFLNRYFPFTAPVQATVADPGRDAARVAGWYIASRRSDTALQLLYQLGQVHVTAQPDGTIEASLLQDQAGVPLRWREVGPLDYREVGGQAHLKFVTGPGGRIRYWISDALPPVELFQRVNGLRQLGTFGRLTLIYVAVLLGTVLIWFGGWIVRRRFGRPLDLTAAQRKWRTGSRFGVLLQLAVVVGWLLFLAVLSQPLSLFHSDGFGPWLIVLYVLGALGIAGAIVVFCEAALRVARGPGGWLCRAGEALLGLSAIYGVWVIVAYRLVTFSLHY